MKQLNPVPEGFSTVTPHLMIKGAKRAVEFYKRAFGAQELERMRLESSGGMLVHSEIKIGDSVVTVGEELPAMGARAPTSLAGSSAVMHMFVDDPDALFESAVSAGAEPLMEPADMFWGVRYGLVSDPFGHVWALAKRIRVVPQAELDAGLEAMFAGA